MNTASLKLYKVGGFVRDRLLGLQPNDIDYTTPLNKKQIIEWCVENGVDYFIANDNYGTVNVKLDGVNYDEVTPFRKDINANGRHCEVRYTSRIEDDLARRDFTINAMAENSEGGIIDPFGGMVDIKNRIIRTVGDPYLRFTEDYLRIIRGLRFATILGFCIEKDTFNAMKQLAYKVNVYVAKERVLAEVNKVLEKADNPSSFFEDLDELGLLKTYFPQLYHIRHDYDYQITNPKYHPEGNLWNHIMSCLNYTQKSDLYMRYACLTHDLGKPFCAEFTKNGYYSFHGHEKYTDKVKEFFSIFNVKKDLVDFCSFIMENHMRMHLRPSVKTIKKLVNKYGMESIRRLVEFAKIDSFLIRSDEKHPVEIMLDEIEQSTDTIKPIVTGKDIINRYNIKTGPEIGKIKERMYDIQLSLNTTDINLIFETYDNRRTK